MKFGTTRTDGVRQEQYVALLFPILILQNSSQITSRLIHESPSHVVVVDSYRRKLALED